MRETHRSARSKIAEITKAMLNEKVHYLAGAIALVELRCEVAAYENDPDFLPFLAIVAELDSLPYAESRTQWTEEHFNDYEKELLLSVEWAKEISLENCQSLAKRFAC